VSVATPRRILHFTLGPVQGFVAQARRTRDLWASSFLLSWLAGQAMAAVEAGGGEIVLPDVTGDALMTAIRNPPGDSPAIGSLPNRFKASVPEGFDAKVCRDAIDAAWQRLAGRVWDRFVQPVEGLGNQTQAIWDRQVAGFWDTAWVMGDDPGDGSDRTWLDRRKNWRTYRPPVEGGDHCTLMGDWQELSGYVRAREKSRQDSFWNALRRQLPNPLDLDEQGRERLCAIALIKRLFLEVAADAIGWAPSSGAAGVVPHWPSTADLAAAGGSPSAFYALLLMDGDRVGTLLGDGREHLLNRERTVAAALSKFAAGVAAVVQSAEGYLVYAGGDDLLALLPLERALTAAINLRSGYVDAFQAQEISATTSAALVFAHYHVPLRQVLREAHKQLDDVAKDGNGRDSLAVCVLSQSGVLRQWVSAWTPKQARKPPPELLNECSAALAGTVSGRFFYKVRETWGDLLSSANSEHTAPAPFNDDQLRRILIAELLAGEKPDAARLARAEALLSEIMTLARRWPGDGRVIPNRYDMDGPLLARFLGQERGGGAE
jgi:hypothetical protein